MKNVLWMFLFWVLMSPLAATVTPDDQSRYRLTVVDYEGLENLSSQYLDQYIELEVGQAYRRAELERWQRELELRLNNDELFLFAEVDLLLYPETNEAEVYLLVAENQLPVAPDGGSLYFRGSWYNQLGEASRLSAYLGYNLQAIELDWPYLGWLPFGLELTGGHRLANMFELDSHAYSDLFVRKFLYWHPLPELRLGVSQQLSGVHYWNQTGSDVYNLDADAAVLLPRWSLGPRLVFDQLSLAEGGGFGRRFEAALAWQPLGQFADAVSLDTSLALRSDFDWLIADLELNLTWSSAEGEVYASGMSGNSDRGHLVQNGELRLTWVPLPELFSTFDLGLALAGQAGLTGDSWAGLQPERNFAVSVLAGPYLRFIPPVKIGIFSGFGFIYHLRDGLGFAWTVKVV